MNIFLSRWSEESFKIFEIPSDRVSVVGFSTSEYLFLGSDVYGHNPCWIFNIITDKNWDLISFLLGCCVVHREIRKRGGKLHQRVGEEDPHNHSATCSTAGMSGTFHITKQPLKYTIISYIVSVPQIFCICFLNIISVFYYLIGKDRCC